MKLLKVLLFLVVCLLGAVHAQDDVELEPIPDGLFPASEEKMTLSVFSGTNPSVENFETNWFSQWYEDKTNISVDWKLSPERNQQLNLLLASNDLPEVIIKSWVSPTQLALYGSQGVFLPLNDLIEEHGIETKKMFEEVPVAKQVATAPDGNIYSLPEVNQCYHCSMSQKMWIYQPWLDALGLDMPETTEEFYEVLKAFKEQDPNGNGQADEIPLATATTGWNTQIDLFLGNAFFVNPPASNGRSIVDGQVVVSFAQPEYKEMLTYLNRLYEERLLYSESFTQDIDGLVRLLNNEEVIVGAVPVGALPFAFADSIGEEDSRLYDYVVLPPLEGPNGTRVATRDAFQAAPGNCVITNAAKDPVAAFKWCDAQLNETVLMHALFGEEDVDWRRAEEGEMGIDGLPARYDLITPWGGLQNKHWSQTNLQYRSNRQRLSEVSDGPLNPEVQLYEQTKKMEPYAQEIETVFPPVYLDGDVATEVSEIEQTLNGFRNEQLALFITGGIPIEGGWEEYLANLEQVGLPRYLEISQEAYDIQQQIQAE